MGQRVGGWGERTRTDLVILRPVQRVVGIDGVAEEEGEGAALERWERVERYEGKCCRRLRPKVKSDAINARIKDLNVQQGVFHMCAVCADSPASSCQRNN